MKIKIINPVPNLGTSTIEAMAAYLKDAVMAVCRSLNL